MTLCKCHGVPMVPRAGRGGHSCRVKKRARDRRYLLTAKGRARARRFRLAEGLGRRRATIRQQEELLK